MKPATLSIHELFQRQRQYAVPLFQRSYVWTKEGQWEPLWEDIERQAAACHANPSQTLPRTHFLGAIVLNVEKIVGNAVPRSEVIDGQQRLTTLQLFLAALRDGALECGSGYGPRFARLTTNDDETIGSIGSFKVWPTNVDREPFRRVMTAGSSKRLTATLCVDDTREVLRLDGAYLYFADAIQEYIGRDGNSVESRDSRFASIFQALRTSLKIINIELEDNDDPQIIFETLNARGQPLLPSDLIRNYVFLEASSITGVVVDDFYTKYWEHFDKRAIPSPIEGETRFWHVNERQGRLTRPRIDLFIFHYLTMKTEQELNIGELFRAFKDWREKNPTPLTDFLQDLRRYGEVFAKLIEPDNGDVPGRFLTRVKVLDNSTIYPLLLYVLALPRDQLSTASRDRILVDLESWLVRRLICQLTTKNYNHFFVSLLSKVKHPAAGEALEEIVRQELSRSVEPTLSWPDDTEFKLGWLSRPVYVRSRSDRAAMVLQALEDRLHTSKNESMTINKALSVEHLLPQKGSIEDYPFADPMPLERTETSQQCRNRLIHTVGNLTLLTQELNSSVSNGAFFGKAGAIRDDSDLRLNAMFRSGPMAPPQDQAQMPPWSETTIVARGHELFGSAQAIWPRPDTTSGK
jgi:Protein of unknown function DUF262/Protein of unknown function (DUF1524)